WDSGTTYRDICYQGEVEFSRYNFEEVEPAVQFKLFQTYEEEAKKLLNKGLALPAYDYTLKCLFLYYRKMLLIIP
ncbi:unnamed protein product, partial [marine sediment metagenome]